MKTKHLFLTLLTLLVCTAIFASNTSVGGIWYNFNSSKLTAEVTFRGSSFNSYTDEYSGVVTIPSTVTYSGKKYSVTSIGDYAFSGCSGLTSVTLGNSVTSFGTHAFYGCTGLTSIEIPNSVKNIGWGAFQSCTGLIYVTIGNSVTSIGDYAFANCTGLTSIEIPNSVTNIRYGAFYGCNGLTSPVYNAHVFAYMPTSYIGSYTIPEGIESIAGDAFAHCSNLSSVSIPNSIVNIGDEAFYSCTGLTSVIIPNSVTSIGDHAFMACHNLTSVTLSNNLTYLSDFGAFQSCTSLKSILIPSSVTYIGTSAFRDCFQLESVEFESPIPPISFGYNVFTGDSVVSIYVPCGSLTTYQNADGWADYADKLFYKPLPYSVQILSDYDHGSVDYNLGSTICDTVFTITAIPDYGYHLAQWNDGNTDLSRSIHLTQDTILSAEFVPNIYTFSANCDDNYGTVESVNGEYPYLTVLTISANPHYGYHFTKWSDNNTNNPRTIKIERDLALTAFFAPNKYTIVDNSNKAQGSITGVGEFDYLSQKELTAVPKYGYRFIQWSDGITDNPRVVTLTQDTAFQALFQQTLEVGCVQTSYLAVGGSGLGQMTTDNSSVWIYSSQYGALGKKQGGATGNLFTPAHDLSNAIKVTLAFQHTHKFATTLSSELTLWVTPDYKGSWAASEWHQLAISPYASNNDWNYVSVSLNVPIEYVGSNTVFAFRYTSTASNYSTWEIKNVKLTADCGMPTYILNATCNPQHGSVVGNTGELAFNEEYTLSAIPNDGYVFTNWSDGNTENPRTIKLTQDTSLVAEFHLRNDSIAHGICGDHLTWTLRYDSILTIEGYGDMYNYTTSSYAPWHEYTANIARIILPEQMTKIGKLAFQDCSKIQSIVLPKELKSIESGAFAWCSSLTSITIPNQTSSIKEFAFQNCHSIASIDIQSNGISLSRGVFYKCNSLNSIIIPEGVTSIGDSAFFKCEHLNSVTLLSQNVLSGSLVMSKIFDKQIKEYKIGSKITNIGNNVFSGCTGITSINIPNSVINIGENAFKGCKGITSVTIPSSVTSIGWHAFSDCAKLTSVTINSNNVLSKNYSSSSNLKYIFGSQVTNYVIGDNVTRIGDNAFRDCDNFTSISIPNSVTSIGVYAFRECSGLTSVTFGNGIKSIESGAFECNVTSVYIYDLSAWCSIEFASQFANPSSSDGCHLYLNDKLITDLVIPGNVKSIGQYAFCDCSDLKSITINKGCESVGKYAFARCSSVKTIILPSTLTDIGEYAFGTEGVLDVYDYATTPQNMSVHNYYTGYELTLLRGVLATARLHVPQQSINLYKEAYFWCYFGSFIPLDTPEPEAIDQVYYGDNSSQNSNGCKILRDGQILILRGDKTYTLTGQEVR